MAANGAAQSPQPPPQLDSEPAAPSDTIESIAGSGPQRPFAILSWHLDDADAAGAIDIRPEPQRVWRHTFGAERKSPSRANFDVARLDADVVLLQGLRMLAHARLLFPASQWRVFASRQMVQSMLPGSSNGARWGSAPRPATTAIAVRYQRRVRMMGVWQIAQVVAPFTDAAGATETAAALAVRLRIDGSTVWAVSADLSVACRGTPAAGDATSADCPAHRELERWQAGRRPGERVVIGGRNTATAPSSPLADPGCQGQSMVITDSADQPLTGEPAGTQPQSVTLLPPETSGHADWPAPQPLRKLVATASAHRHPLAGCIGRLTLE